MTVKRPVEANHLATLETERYLVAYGIAYQDCRNACSSCV
jgi:hypothetical protein